MIHYRVGELRHMLYQAGYDANEVNDAVESIEQDLYNKAAEIATEKLIEALEYAKKLGAKEFINTAILSENGSVFEIGTTTGKTDFSRRKREMLPGILNKAKTNKITGERYQRIAIKPKQAMSSFDTDNNLQSAVSAARSVAQGANTMSVTDIANQALAAFRSGMSSSAPTSTRGPVQNWVTARESQNPATDWVVPGKDMDMTEYLASLNIQMNAEIRELVESTINPIIERLY